jgi:hypothetical protein
MAIKMAENWRAVVICPVKKKEDKLQCSSFRGISLLNVRYIVLITILSRRIVPYVAEIFRRLSV